MLRPNQYVRARLKGAIRPNAIVVPQRAVQQGAKGHFVWVVDKNDTAELRPVTVGDWDGDDWFRSRADSQPNSVVVVDGALRLTPGAAVKAAAIACGRGSACGCRGDDEGRRQVSTGCGDSSRVAGARVFREWSATLDANAKERCARSATG